MIDINFVVNKIIFTCHKIKSAIYYRIILKKIGSNSVIINPILISNANRISIGDRVLIRNGVRLEVVLDGVNKYPSLTIGDDTNIEQNVHIVCHNRISIGKRVSITANCAIVDTSHPYDDITDPVKIGARLCQKPSFVEIGDNCFIGIGTIILPNVSIGEYCIIGAGSVVKESIPAYCVAVGRPAQVIRRYNFDSGEWVSVK